jgi:hypothetical protein
MEAFYWMFTPDARFSKLYIFKNFRNVKKIPTVVSIQKSRSELFNDFCLFCTQSRKVTKLLSFTRRTVNHRKKNMTKFNILSRTNIGRSNEILGWGGVGNRQLLCFFKAQINWSMLTANLKFRAKKEFLF